MDAPKNGLTIALVGPESSGKSTLCCALAETFKTHFVAEYARTYFEKRRPEHYTPELIYKLMNQQLELETKKARDIPSPKIDLEIEALAPTTSDQPDIFPIQIQVAIENKGSRSMKLTYDAPLMVIAKVSGNDQAAAVKEPMVTLPWVKLDCKSDQKCGVALWKRGELEPGGVGYLSFLHTGLARGLYYFQFQLRIPQEQVLRGSPFDLQEPVYWTRAKYFQVKEPAATLAAKAGPNTPNK